MEKDKLIAEYQADLKNVMDRIEEIRKSGKVFISVEESKRLALLRGMQDSLGFAIKEMSRE